MVVVVALVIGAFVLWLWLAGHWFGRVLAFLSFSAVMVGLAALFMSSRTLETPVYLTVYALCIAAAWLISTLPRRIQNARVRSMLVQ